jgi:hypothetical protein
VEELAALFVSALVAAAQFCANIFGATATRALKVAMRMEQVGRV